MWWLEEADGCRVAGSDTGSDQSGCKTERFQISVDTPATDFIVAAAAADNATGSPHVDS